MTCLTHPVPRRAARAASVLACAVLAACATAASAPPANRAFPASSPISDVRYEIGIDSTTARTHDLAVAMTFRVHGPGPVVLALPAWSPGHYELLWFARRVSEFGATDGATSLAWRKLDYQTWEVTTGGASLVTVSFRYRADAHDRAVAYTEPNLAFFNGTNVFPYPVGLGFAWPSTVHIAAPADWRVATGMTPGAAANTFVAANYHDLTDMPFVIGRFDFDSVRTADGSTWVRLASYPAGGVSRAGFERTLDWMARLVPVEGAVFHDVPFRVYTVLQLSNTVVNGGGLEHQNSQLDGVPMGGGDGGSPGLYAHELFHAWNVKRLRPADMVPYRYDDAQPTPWLWVSEGVTDYYADVALARSGIFDSTQFEEAMANDISAVQSSVPVALGDASLSAWIGAVDGTAGIYYPKGATAGLLLDIMIRNASDGARSLDDVMRALYDETYRAQWRGFTSADWWGAVSRFAGGKSFADFDRRFITGREPMPIDSVLALAGWRTATDTVRELRLGIGTAPSDRACSLLRYVEPGGPGARAGLQVGDCIASVGAVPVTTLSSWNAVRARYAGTTSAELPMEIRRGGATLTLTLPVELAARVRTRLLRVAGAGARAERIREGILRGPAAGP